MEIKLNPRALIILLSIASARAQDCSGIFRVYRGFDGLHAEIIKSNNVLESVLHLEVIMSVATSLNSDSAGKIILTNRDVYNDLLNHRDLRYRIDFPFVNPSPVATMINFNGRTICTGPPVQGYTITTLKLDHTHTLYNIPNIPNGYQAPSTTPSSILGSIVGLITNPFAAFMPSTQRIPQYTQPTYYSQPVYQYPTTPVQREPQTVYYNEVSYQPQPQTVRPTYYTSPRTRYTTRPTYYTRPANTQPPSTPPPLPSIVSYISSTSERLDSLNYECGMPARLQQNAVSLVVGGNVAHKGQFPWLAAFYYNGYGDNGFICGGSLISAKLVITAAHCIHDKNTDLIRKAEATFFKFGKYYLESPDTERDVIVSAASMFVMHPEYSAQVESYDADIAIAILTRSIMFTNFIRPICIWTQTSGYNDIISQRGNVAGWGKTATSVSASDKPYWTPLPVVDAEKCLRSNLVFAKITSPRTFCAGDNDGRGPCLGDSGGAFTVKSGDKWYLRGIVSSAILNKELYTCDTKNYAVFTDVASFTDWIVQYVERYG